MPENHGCTISQTGSVPIRPDKKQIPLNYFWNIITKLLTLKNFTIISILLMIVGYLPTYFPRESYQQIFQFALETGILFFLIAYVLYAINCWRAGSKICAVLMVSIPLFVYSLSTVKIPDSTLNTLLYLAVIFCIYAILSAILLYICSFVEPGVHKYVFKGHKGSVSNFIPGLTYSLIGVVIVSLLAINLSGVALFSQNLNNDLPSPTNYTDNSQDIPSTPAQNSMADSTVQTTPVTPVNTPLPFPANNGETGLTPETFNYVLRGQSGTINLNLYSSVNNKIISEGPPASCIRYNGDTRPCTNAELQISYLKFLNDPYQKNDLDNLVTSIKSKTSVQDDQARIAISLVQHIPYDTAKLNAGSNKKSRYPYEVLFDDKGVCEEKSLLLAYLLRGFGYGVVLFEYPSENHMALGIKSPVAYAYKNTGYAFIETTQPTIPTDDQENYIGVGKLTESPNIFTVSDGISFNSISEEYQDFLMYNQLGNGQTLAPEQYREWETLVWKYGLIMSDGTTISENPEDKPLCNNGGMLCNDQCYTTCPSHLTGKCTTYGEVCE